MSTSHPGTISIHTTAKVVTALQGSSWLTIKYFNPHHREGGDLMDIYTAYCNRISIHTTAKVVTLQIRPARFGSKISIHTTAKVVTAKMPKFHSYFCIKLLINRLFHTNLTTPFPSIPPFSITQHPKIWCESPNVFLFTSYSH